MEELKRVLKEIGNRIEEINSRHENRYEDFVNLDNPGDYADGWDKKDLEIMASLYNDLSVLRRAEEVINMHRIAWDME